MMGATHAVHGAIAGGGAGALSGDPKFVLAGAALGALAGFGPDVDHKPAPAGRLLPPVRWAVHGLSRSLGLPIHRGITHTVLAAVVVGAALLLVPAWVLAIAVFAGLLPMLSSLFKLSKCRGITRAAMTCVVLAASGGAGAATLQAPPWTLSLAITAGWLAALVGDDATKTALPYAWWPFVQPSDKPKRVRFKFLRIRTGGKMERWVIHPASVLALLGGLYLAVAYLPG